MTSYYIDEAALDLPDTTFVDKTIHGLEHELPGGGALCVFVHRSPMAGRALRDLVKDNVALNTKRLLGFEVLNETEADLSGRPGILLETRFRDRGAVFRQRQAHVAFEGKWMVFAVSAPAEARSLCDETFDEIVSSIVWRVD